jgi:uncharacterized membrane protein
MDSTPAGNLEQQLAELRSRVRRLEDALSRQGIALEREPAPPIQPLPQPPPASAAPPVPPPLPGVAAPVPASPPFPSRPAISYAAPKSRADGPSLESRIGSQWFNRIGILAVLIGAAWFLKFAFDNHWIGPLGRILIGLISGAALVAWSERFRSRGYAVFSYSLKAVGSGILYLSLWAAFSYFHLISATVAFVAMILVTAFNGFMSWRQDAELLALYAIAGGLCTPLLVSTGGNHEVTLFSYLLLLDAAVLILVALRPWSRLLFGAFAGTVVFFVGWWSAFFSQDQATRTAFFIACFFLMFAAAPRLVHVKVDGDAKVSGWDTLAIVLLPIANAALGFIAFYGLLTPHAEEWAAPWIAVAFAAFYLGMRRLPEQGVLHRSPGVLRDLHLTAAIVFLTIAIPLKAHGRWLTIGWLAEGAALLWVSTRMRGVLVRVLALLSLVLGIVAVLTVNPPASTTPIFNQRFAVYCFAIAVCAFVRWVAQRAAKDQPAGTGSAWHALVPISGLAVSVLILIAICLEIHSFWWSLRWAQERVVLGGNPRYHWEQHWALMLDYKMYAQFTYSAFFMLYGGALLGIGFWRRSAFLRWQALVLLAISVGKVFLVDVSELSQGYRILSFLGLGVLLLAVSFIYQRDWLNLRRKNPPPEPEGEAS